MHNLESILLEVRRKGRRSVTIATSIPGRHQGIELRIERGEFLLMSSSIGRAEGFEPPDVPGIVFHEEDGVWIGTAVVPIETPSDVVRKMMQYVADRCDLQEYLTTRGNDEL